MQTEGYVVRMSKYRDSLDSVLRRAGAVIMQRRSLRERSIEKTPNEIVTAADIASQDFITQQLQQLTPDIPVFAEEGDEDKSEADTRWILDPIDGTTPWVWGNSGFAISLALEVEGVLRVGAVYDPVFQELFYAERGAGATCNGQIIQVAEHVGHRDALIVVDWGNSDDKRAEGLRYFNNFMLPDMFARRVVPQFAPALGLCRVAEGRTHGVVCNDTLVEDHAAGALILNEAGGYVGNFPSGGFDHRSAGIIATNSAQLAADIGAQLAMLGGH